MSHVNVEKYPMSCNHFYSFYRKTQHCILLLRNSLVALLYLSMKSPYLYEITNWTRHMVLTHKWWLRMRSGDWEDLRLIMIPLGDRGGTLDGAPQGHPSVQGQYWSVITEQITGRLTKTTGASRRWLEQGLWLANNERWVILQLTILLCGYGYKVKHLVMWYKSRLVICRTVLRKLLGVK